MEQGSALRFVVGGVAHLAAQDVKVMMEEHSDVPRALRLVGHDAAADKERLVEVDRVGELQGECKARVAEPDAGEERLLVEAEVALPAWVAEPAELALRPDANAKRMSQRMVLLANVGPVEIAYLVGLVEVDQQAPVANRQVAWHRPLPNPVRLGIAFVRPS